MSFAKALLCALLSCFGCVAAGEAGVTANGILIGMTAPFSGPNGAYGLDMKRVIQTYFRQINEGGGINGRMLSLRVLDDGYETERAVANTKALINTEKVFALLASYGSSATTAAMNEAFGVARVPLVGAISGADSIRQLPKDNPNNRYMFNVRASYANETEALVKHLVSLGIENIAVLYQNDGFGKSGLEGVVGALDKHQLTPTAVATVERNSVDVAQAVQQIVRVNPQAVIMVTLYKPTAAFVRAMRKADQLPQFMTLSPVGAELLVQELGEAARGIGISQVMPSPWSDTTPLAHEYQKLIGPQAKPSYYGFEAYAMAKVLVEAIRKAGKELTREGLVSALESMHNLDLGGYRVSYSANDRRGSRYVDLTVIGPGGRIMR
ncbi:MAG: leucine ABC transporter subunit substrate-binding protein LivK [Candidatus Accumulibacter appositus]|uniref:Leucine ABC transporter subunit substrate-binding protein LivK n=1 Tax=Candidatus Accumulibacter appositus TaxID=1454003 RepID=A0A011QKD9_9PROT|nr:ABC transporter substrate-binding protein [Accumulibacter sp.]EXI79344.1 MAG: leucine ABC transporter subunit substrate-binding protein LivK [Candidatus Accumulibacter appositus]HRF04030.1 ABC transporter substrate-binding protein [Accumulibacter sp.]